MRRPPEIFYYIAFLVLAIAASECWAEISIPLPDPQSVPTIAPPAPTTTPPTEAPPPEPYEPIEEGPCRLALDLLDGSEVIGTPDLEFMSLHTAFAKLDIPLKQISSMVMQEEENTVSVELLNGDTITGQLRLKSCSLKTSFGKITVPIAQARRLSVVFGNVPRGLLLWNCLDGRRSVVGPDVEFLCKEGFVDGKRGRAVKVAGNNEWAFQVPTERLRELPRGTLEYWMKVIKKPATVSHGSGPVYTIATGGINVQYNANDGGAHGKYAIQCNGTYVYTEQYSHSKSTDLLGDVGAWNHYAILWDVDGIEGKNGAKLEFLINGKPHGNYQKGTRPFQGPFPEDRKFTHVAFHNNHRGFGSVMVYDELKIWDRPIEDFSRIPKPATEDGGPDNGKPVPLVVNLSEGSRIIGTPKLEALTFTTESFGRVSLPMRRVQKILMGDEDEPTKVWLDSGDLLAGAIGEARLPLTTIFGDISVKVVDIRGVESQPE